MRTNLVNNVLYFLRLKLLNFLLSDNSPRFNMQVMILILILGFVSIETIGAISRKDKGSRIKDRYKNNSNTAKSNPCKNEENDSPTNCFCNPDIQVGNATRIECWVFGKNLTKDYGTWSSFINQPRIEEMQIVVRPNGFFNFIPTTALEYLGKLKMIDIKYGSIDEIHPYAFANLTQLHDIKLMRNQIVTLSNHAIAHLPNLTELNLDENRISELRRDVFVDLPNLQKFYITQNNLSVLQEGAFKHLTHLLELELSNNYVSVLTKDTFNGLSELKKLDLNNNTIRMLGDLTFAELWVLEVSLFVLFNKALDESHAYKITHKYRTVDESI